MLQDYCRIVIKVREPANALFKIQVDKISLPSHEAARGVFI